MQKRYLCVSGEVLSRHDGERHFVSAKRLPGLYGIHAADCIFVDTLDDPKCRGLDMDNLIVVGPDSTGIYRLNQAARRGEGK